MKRFLKIKETGILLIIVLLIVVISISNPVFIRIDNIIDILKSNTVLGMVACGMLLVIITGGIDVSVGAIIAACTCITGTFLIHVTDSVVLAFVAGAAAGALMGLINGLLISKLKIPPIVATLGMMSIVNGAMIYITNGTWITDIPENFLAFGRTKLFSIPVPGAEPAGIPVQIFFLIGVALLTWFLLKYTLFGRGVYALGGNSVSAERLGYNLTRIQILLYTYLGFVTGLASVVHTSIMRQVDPNAFQGFEMQVIAAVVLGGANIAGGFGSVAGTLLGVALLAISSNGLILMKIPTFWQSIVIGAIILAAVSVDVLQRNRQEKRRFRVDVE